MLNEARGGGSECTHHLSQKHQTQGLEIKMIQHLKITQFHWEFNSSHLEVKQPISLTVRQKWPKEKCESRIFNIYFYLSTIQSCVGKTCKPWPLCILNSGLVIVKGCFGFGKSVPKMKTVHLSLMSAQHHTNSSTNSKTAQLRTAQLFDCCSQKTYWLFTLERTAHA